MDGELGLGQLRSPRKLPAGVLREDYVTRYANGEWRTSIFLDMLRGEIPALESRETFLDIGCGRGIDGEPTFQEELAEYCGSLIAVEPNQQVPVADCFDVVYRCDFEQAPLDTSSVDFAWAFMVLEYLTTPELFFAQLYRVLRPGAVFWAFTIDARHYGTGLLPQRGALKLRCNTPRQLASLTSQFQKLDIMSFRRAGGAVGHLPRVALPICFAIDKLLAWTGKPGPTFAVRLER